MIQAPFQPPSVLGVIPARGGSRGVAHKNVHPLAGKPLIAHTIEAARASRWLSEFVVSTEDRTIRDLAVSLGASAPFLRPPELATDAALAVPTIQHAVREMEKRRGAPYEYVVMLQPTAPLRTSADIDAALEKLHRAGADGVISICDVGNNHPMKMKKIVDGELLDYEPPPVENPPRQSLPPIYIVNGAIYAARRDVLLERGSFKGDRCLALEMPPERSVNLDTETDFLVAEHYFRLRRDRDLPSPSRDCFSDSAAWIG